MEIAPSTMKKLLKEHGAETVSDDAAAELAETLEVFAGHISEEAIARTEDQNKTVITKADIDKALE